MGSLKILFEKVQVELLQIVEDWGKEQDSQVVVLIDQSDKHQSGLICKVVRVDARK